MIHSRNHSRFHSMQGEVNTLHRVTPALLVPVTTIILSIRLCDMLYYNIINNTLNITQTATTGKEKRIIHDISIYVHIVYKILLLEMSR